MDDIQKSIVALLRKAAAQLRDAKLPEELAIQLEQRIKQVDQPCVVAVVGQVKAGKSTFINALLGVDLAKVDTTETTATINYFRYGKVSLEYSVRCFWRGGLDEYVDLAFVDSLQGNTLETLQKADGIDHLEYYLDNAYLEKVTLVDTPGTGAVVDKHQDRVAEFMNLQQQLRTRHNADTQRIGSNADAVIYVINSTARELDKAFLEEFQEVSQQQSRSFNAIAVMAKIDLYPDVLKRRTELAIKIATQLKESLNTVVPISAGLHRAVERLLENNEAGLRRLIEAIRRIPATYLDKFLDDEDLYLELDDKTYPINLEERKELLGNMPWTVFTTIARAAADPSRNIQAVKQYLNDLAGFEQLRKVLEKHFFKRSHILRCHRILSDTRKIISDIEYNDDYLPVLRRKEREEKLREAAFLAFIRQAAPSNPKVAHDLEELVKVYLLGRVKRIETMLEELKREIDSIFYQLDQYNNDFEALRQTLDYKDLFSRKELDELQPLFGLHGIEIEKRLPPGKLSRQYVSDQQIYWRKIIQEESNAIRRAIAQQAVSRYGHILGEM